MSRSSRIRAYYLYPRPRGDRLRDCRAGLGPEDAFHGLFHMPSFGIETQYDDNPRNALWKAFHPIERLIARTGLGFSLAQAIRLLAQLRAADVLVTTADTSGLPVAFVKSLGLLRTPQVFISMGLTDRMRRLVRHPLLGWYRWMMSSVERVLVLGESERTGFTTLLGVAPDRVYVVPFGVDADFWHPLQLVPEDFLLSTGSDPARDYCTLLEAVGDRWPLVIVSRHGYFRGRTLPSNVRLCPDVSWIQLRQMHSRARLVVVPLQDVDQTSGQTAALQAMATGRPLVITRIRGTWDATLEDGVHCVFARPNDPEDLRHAIKRVWNDPELSRRLGRKARQYVESGFNSRAYAACLAQHLTAVVRQE